MSEAQLHRTHKTVMSPSTSRKVGDVLIDIEKWESQLRKYCQCGGPTIPDGTKILIAMGILSASVKASIRLALKGINDFANFKDSLRATFGS